MHHEEASDSERWYRSAFPEELYVSMTDARGPFGNEIGRSVWLSWAGSPSLPEDVGDVLAMDLQMIEADEYQRALLETHLIGDTVLRQKVIAAAYTLIRLTKRIEPASLRLLHTALQLNHDLDLESSADSMRDRIESVFPTADDEGDVEGFDDEDSQQVRACALSDRNTPWLSVLIGKREVAKPWPPPGSVPPIVVTASDDEVLLEVAANRMMRSTGFYVDAQLRQTRWSRWADQHLGVEESIEVWVDLVQKVPRHPVRRRRVDSPSTIGVTVSINPSTDIDVASAAEIILDACRRAVDFVVARRKLSGPPELPHP